MLSPSAFLTAAASVLAATGLIHSVLGEHLIFRRWRSGKIAAAGDDAFLARRHARIIWATWHGLTVFAWASAWLAAGVARNSPRSALELTLLDTLVTASAAVGLLVLIATRGKHPGWMALFLSAILMVAGSR